MFLRLKYFFGMLLAFVFLTACGSDKTPTNPPVNQPPVSSEPEPEPEPTELNDMPDTVKRLKGPMFDCIDRVWPSAVAGYQSAQVIVTENRSEGDVAYLWHMNGDEESIEELDAQTLSAEWFSAFTFSEFRGKKTLGFNVSQWFAPASSSSESLWNSNISTLFHEGFHLFGESNWQYTPGGRDQEYPIRWEPRYLRAQLLFALEDALLQGTDLSAAAYWYERYLSEYTEEAAYYNHVDRTEGGTRYADVIMTALAGNGCEASEEELLADIRQHLPPIHFRLEGKGESYVLGLLAGLLLRENPVDLWHTRVEEGETLQGILLDGVIATPQPEDTELQASVQSSAENQNDYLDTVVGDSLAAYDSDDYYRLVFDKVNSLGSYQLSETYRLTSHAELTAISVSAWGTFVHGAAITLNQKTMLSLESSPCYGFYGLPAVVTLPKSAVTLHSDGTADADTGSVQFTGLQLEAMVDDGHSWLCPLEGVK